MVCIHLAPYLDSILYVIAKQSSKTPKRKTQTISRQGNQGTEKLKYPESSIKSSAVAGLRGRHSWRTFLYSWPRPLSIYSSQSQGNCFPHPASVNRCRGAQQLLRRSSSPLSWYQLTGFAEPLRTSEGKQTFSKLEGTSLAAGCLKLIPLFKR